MFFKWERQLKGTFLNIIHNFEAKYELVLTDYCVFLQK
jgi:hypothetical protein